MITDWRSALERDEWPSGWVNVGETVDGGLPRRRIQQLVGGLGAL